MLNDILHYLIFTSAILIYGIGLNRATELNEGAKIYFLNSVKYLLISLVSSALTYLLIISLFARFEIIELYPFAATLIFSLLLLLVDSIPKVTLKTGIADFCLILLCVLLGLGEGNSILQVLLITGICVISFVLFIPLLVALRKRIELSHPAFTFENSTLILITFIIIIFALFAWNVSWLNPKVLQ